MLAPTAVYAQATWQATSPPLVTAENEPWFRAGDPIIWSGAYYYPAGTPRFFSPSEMVRSGSFRGVPLYTDATLDPYSIVYVPIAGGMMQPYQRRRDGALAGTTGSTTPAFPPTAATELPRTPPAAGVAEMEGLRQAPAAPAYAPAYEVPIGAEAPARGESSVATTGRTVPLIPRGPVVTAEHRKRIIGYIDAGVAQGAALVVDGRGLVIKGHERGFFVGPTLFDRVSPAMTIYQDEIFGPVLVVVRAASLEEAISIVNANPYGNGTAIFTRSGAAARIFEHEIQVGMVGINVPIPVPMAFYSFGGWKSSLFGDLHVHGAEGIKFYTRTKAVTRRWTEDAIVGAFHMPTLG